MRMFKIRNTDLYQHLLAISATKIKTGEAPDKNKMWAALFGSEKEPKRKDNRMPNLAGGLNRVEIRPNGICFIDSGGSCGGSYKDNSSSCLKNNSAMVSIALTIKRFIYINRLPLI